MSAGVLDRETILELIRAPAPLIEGYSDLAAQIQPHGFDLTLREMRAFTAAGKLGAGMEPSSLPDSTALSFGARGRLELATGAYIVTLNEIVNLPLNVMALARPRSSLLRCGVAIHTAVWEAGYRGRSQALLTVYNPSGYTVVKDARLLQMVFMYLTKPVGEGYQGRYLGENI